MGKNPHDQAGHVGQGDGPILSHFASGSANV